MSFLDPAIQWFEAKVAAVGDVFSSVTHGVLTVVRGLPGASLVEDAINQGADWIKGIVNLPGADVVLKSLAMLTYGPVAQSLGGVGWFGPQLASAVWALPGVVRGQNFFDSWAFEVKDRTEKLAAIYGPDFAKQAFEILNTGDGFRYLNRRVYEELFPDGIGAPDLPAALDPATLEAGLKRLNITPEEMAKEIHFIRPDIAAIHLNYASGNANLYNLSTFDLATGKRAVLDILGDEGGYVRRPRYGGGADYTYNPRYSSDKLPAGLSSKDIAALMQKPSVVSPRPRVGLFDHVADLALLAGAATGIYLFARAFRSRRQRRRLR